MTGLDWMVALFASCLIILGVTWRCLARVPVEVSAEELAGLGWVRLTGVPTSDEELLDVGYTVGVVA